MRLWIVGKPAGKGTHDAWEFQGVFNSRERALDACTGPNHFLFPATLNERLPEETVSSSGTEFPNRPGASSSGRKPR